MRVLSALCALVMAVSVSLVATSAEAATDSGTYVGLTSARLLDTRTGNGAAKGAVGPNASVTVQITSRGGVPSANVAAVVLNLTVTSPSQPGFLTAYPAGTVAPATSNINFTAGRTLANHVTVKLGGSGAVSIKNNSVGSAHVIADIAGYYVGGTPEAGGTFTALTPARVLDTRNGTGAPVAAVAAYGSVVLKVAGAGGVPLSGAGAVALNVTVTRPGTNGFLTVFPSDVAVPNVSNLNFTAGLTVANAVNVRLSASGQVTLYNGSSSTVHVVADVAGWFKAFNPASFVPGSYEAVEPVRWIDSRVAASNPFGDASPMQPFECWSIPVSNPGVIRAVVFNATVTRPTAPGYLVVYQGDADPYHPNPPNASNINFVAGQTVPNLTTTATREVVLSGTTNRISMCNSSTGSTHVILDLAGGYHEGQTASLKAQAGESGAGAVRYPMPH